MQPRQLSAVEGDARPAWQGLADVAPRPACEGPGEAARGEQDPVPEAAERHLRNERERGCRCLFSGFGALAHLGTPAVVYRPRTSSSADEAEDEVPRVQRLACKQVRQPCSVAPLPRGQACAHVGAHQPALRGRSGAGHLGLGAARALLSGPVLQHHRRREGPVSGRLARRISLGVELGQGGGQGHGRPRPPGLRRRRRHRLLHALHGLRGAAR
mmetsp:Transcript_80040/g.229740  ORF Transcript_80040/g.229740 Transcript_80040/m.229740 type:complete len:214 (+) Transcript_80040:97-738(+)